MDNKWKAWKIFNDPSNGSLGEMRQMFLHEPLRICARDSLWTYYAIYC